MPERRPNERSESRRGELFPGPEWTSLNGRGESMRGTWMRKRGIRIHRKKDDGTCMVVCYRESVTEAKSEIWRAQEGKKGGKTHDS